MLDADHTTRYISFRSSCVCRGWVANVFSAFFFHAFFLLASSVLSFLYKITHTTNRFSYGECGAMSHHGEHSQSTHTDTVMQKKNAYNTKYTVVRCAVRSRDTRWRVCEQTYVVAVCFSHSAQFACGRIESNGDNSQANSDDTTASCSKVHKTMFGMLYDKQMPAASKQHSKKNPY